MIKEFIERHITQGPYNLKSNEVLENKRFVQTGSTYGRFIFTERAPMILGDGVKNVVIQNCDLIGMPDGVGISISLAESLIQESELQKMIIRSIKEAKRQGRA